MRPPFLAGITLLLIAAPFGRPSAAAPLSQLVHEWRRFPFLDPDLPADMLPPGWPRRRAHDLFGERHAHWHNAAQEYFRTLAI